jgi:heme oxygenase
MVRESAPGTSRGIGATRRALINATREIHERLHRVPTLERLAEGRLGRSEYIELLRGFLRFHLVLESRLSLGPDLAMVGIVVRKRQRSHLLYDDLAALGVRKPEVPPPPGFHLATPVSVPAALGYLYVSEGSRLGGRVLASALNGTLPPGRAEGRALFLGDVRQDGQGWRDFVTCWRTKARTWMPAQL